MARRNKYLQRALDALGMKYDKEQEEDFNQPLNTLKDLEALIASQNREKSSMIETIAKGEDCLRDIQSNIDLLENLKDQYECEEIKALNPRAVSVYKINP